MTQPTGLSFETWATMTTNDIKSLTEEIRAYSKEVNTKFEIVNKKVNKNERLVSGTKEKDYKNGLLFKQNAHLEYHKKHKLKPRHWIAIGALLCILVAVGLVYLPELTRAILSFAKIPFPK